MFLSEFIAKFFVASSTSLLLFLCINVHRSLRNKELEIKEKLAVGHLKFEFTDYK